MNASKRNLSLLLVIVVILSLIFTSCNKSADINDTSLPADNNPPLSYLSFFPDTLVTIVGAPITLTITARDTSGAEISDVVPIYSSSDDQVVGIQTDGRINANGIGQAILTASAGGLTSKVVIYVGAATYDLKNLGVWFANPDLSRDHDRREEGFYS